MPTKHDGHGLETLCADFTGVSPEQLPQSPPLMADCLLAESVRIALAQMSPAPPAWPIAHQLTVRAWVTRKLRGVLPGVQDKESDEVGRVLRSGAGPNMEFLGDVLFLTSGNCMPAPTRAVPVGSGRFLLVSGLPSKRFVDAGIKLQIHGVVRWIVDTSEGRLAMLGIPIQSKESFTGLEADAVGPEVFLHNCLTQNPRADISSVSGAEYYVGNVRDSYGFEFGSISRRVTTSEGSVGILRTPREWEQFGYWIRLDAPTKPTVVVPIPRPEWKRAALAFDALSGHARVAVLSTEGTETILSLNIPPPEAVMRWILASAGLWLGYQRNRLRWAIPAAASESLGELLNRLWLRVEMGTSR